MRVAKQYSHVCKIFQAYWKGYGGWRALVCSPYLHLAVVLTLLMNGTWTVGGWWSDPLSVLPNLIGFTLGGYAILMAFGDEEFRKLLAGTDSPEKNSPFIGVNVAFVHFILVQISALLVALVAKAHPLSTAFPDLKNYIADCKALLALRGIVGNSFWFFGYFLFIYAMLSAIAAVASIFRVARWYDKSRSNRISQSLNDQ